MTRRRAWAAPALGLKPGLAAALLAMLAPQGLAQGNPAQERELEELPQGLLLDDEVARLAVRAEIERPQLYLVEVVFLRNRDNRSSNSEFFFLQEYGDQLRPAVRLPLPQELDEYRRLPLPPLSPLPPPPGVMGQERMLQVLREAMAAERRARGRAAAPPQQTQAQADAEGWKLDRAPLPCRGMLLRHCPGPLPVDPKMQPAVQPGAAGGQETADGGQGEGPQIAQNILGEIAAVLPEGRGGAPAADEGDAGGAEASEEALPTLPDIPYARAQVHSDTVQDLITRVQASPTVTLLSSYAWVQHLPPPRGAPNVLLPPLSESLSEPEQRVEDAHQPLHGFVRVYRGRFRHMVMDLRLRNFLPATEELMQTLGLAPEPENNGQGEGLAQQEGAEGEGRSLAEVAEGQEEAADAAETAGEEGAAEAAADTEADTEAGAEAERKLAQLSGPRDLPVYLDWSHRLKDRMQEHIAREKEAGGEVVEEVISTEGVELQFLEGWRRSWRPDKIVPPDFGLPARPEGIRFHRVPRGHLLWESYALQESRRIDDDSLHYFDHPRFGAFARITPIEEVSFPTDGDDTASSP